MSLGVWVFVFASVIFELDAKNFDVVFVFDEKSGSSGFVMSVRFCLQPINEILQRWTIPLVPHNMWAPRFQVGRPLEGTYLRYRRRRHTYAA